MFGVYRTLLALAVAAQHMATIPYIGVFAVHGFFVLSGYLMTSVMQETYGYSHRGRLAFAVNRALRLYPLYWVVLILTVATIALFGEQAVAAFKETMVLPRSAGELGQTISMIFATWTPMREPVRLVPPIWALTIELFFYALIAIGISRTRRRTALWLVFSLAYVVGGLAFFGDDFTWRYSSVPAGSLPFAVGATLYHWRDGLTALIAKLNHLALAGCGICLFPLLALSSWLLETYGLKGPALSLFYLNIPLHAAIILALASLTGSLPTVRHAADAAIGRYSYPIYLLHYLAGFWVTVLFVDRMGLGHHVGLLTTFGLAAFLSVAVGTLMIRFIDRPIDAYRHRGRLRRPGREGAAAPPGSLQPLPIT